MNFIKKIKSFTLILLNSKIKVKLGKLSKMNLLTE